MPVQTIDPGSSRHEGGNTMIVLGAMLLMFELIFLLWVGWSIRAGNMMVQIAMAGLAAVAVIMILWGIARQRSASV